jgi:hypothetical protein
VDPEVNGVIMGRGAEGGPGPPSGEQDKQLICNSGGGETPMGEREGQQDWSDAASRTHHAQSTINCEVAAIALLYIVITMCKYLDYLFQENKSYGSKKPFAFIV